MTPTGRCTALAGSGPAYIYYLVEAFEQAAISGGLDPDIARDLFVQTIAGSAEMLKQTKETPAVLRHNVTSPGGTTEAGINYLQQNGFAEILAACLKQAETRSRELGKLYL